MPSAAVGCLCAAIPEPLRDEGGASSADGWAWAHRPRRPVRGTPHPHPRPHRECARRPPPIQRPPVLPPHAGGCARARAVARASVRVHAHACARASARGASSPRADSRPPWAVGAGLHDSQFYLACQMRWGGAERGVVGRDGSGWSRHLIIIRNEHREPIL